MENKERVKRIIARKPVEIPYSFDLTCVIHDDIAEYYGIDPIGVQRFIGGAFSFNEDYLS